jgi:hypothetical protein
MRSAEQVALVSSQGYENMAPFLISCGATLVFEIRVPIFCVSLTLVHLTSQMRPTKAAGDMTF